METDRSGVGKGKSRIRKQESGSKSQEAVTSKRGLGGLAEKSWMLLLSIFSIRYSSLDHMFTSSSDRVLFQLHKGALQDSKSETMGSEIVV